MRFHTTLSCSALLMAVSATPALAANYPLELLHPREAGTSPDAEGPAISSAHRVHWAYPGVEYNIRAVVSGGAYPFGFALDGAPEGMSVDPCTGVITWADPQASATGITLTVTDAEGTVSSATWSVTVDAERFAFLDAENGVNAEGNGCSSGCGEGSIANPWRTISDAYYNGVGRILYFRSGTYDVLDLPRDGVGGPWELVQFREEYQPITWLEYPGDEAIIDYGFDPATPEGEAGPLIRLWGNAVYVDGFETRNSHIMAWQLISEASNYSVFRRLRMGDHGPGFDGSNSSLIMTTTGFGNVSRYMAIQDCEFFGNAEGSGIKIYSQEKLVVEGNVFHDDDNAPAMHLKSDIRQFTVQNNLFHDMSDSAIAGNMHEETTHGEVRFNLVRNAPANDALTLNQDSMAKAIHVYRNTFVGRSRVWNTDSEDGPFYFANNVRVDDTPVGSCLPDSRLYCDAVSDTSRIQLSSSPDDDLDCAPEDGCVDADGLLAGSYRTSFLGTKGHERVGECQGTVTSGAGAGGAGGAGSGAGGGSVESGAGGLGSGNGGAGAAANATGGSGSGDGGGCGCRVASPSVPRTAGVTALLLLAAALLRRSRRRSGLGQPRSFL